MSGTTTLSVTLNGAARTILGPMTLQEFLAAHDLVLPFMAVARNGEVLHRSEYPQVRLEDGDRLEIVRMVGGG